MSGARTATPGVRLLVVAPSAYPLGGVATWLDALVPGLRGRGWRVDVALLAGYHHDVDRYLELHPALAEPLRVAAPSGTREGRLRALGRAIRAVDPDLVLAVNVGDLEEAVARLRRIGARAPRLVVSQHGLQADFFDHLAAHRGAVDGVVATNRLSARLAVDYAGVEPGRVAYAPYGVDLPSTAPAAPATGDPLRIAWVGRLEQEQKRVRDLVAICARLAADEIDYRLRIAGDGPERLRLAAKLQSQVAAGRVDLLGAVAADELAARVYADRDVLLVTSSWETGPIVAWEATAAGLAIVAARFLGSGLEGAFVDGQTAGLFPVGDAGAAADVLARVRDAGRRARLVANARRLVAARYTTAASLDAWAAALERLAGLPQLPAPVATEPPPRAGRLDRWLGVGLAESVRERLVIRHLQASAGDEWPHALVAAGPNPEFELRAATLDAEAAETEVG